ncbi:hypothetical protein GY967_22735, partial [Escherichia coli]|nr:hypothetical protein [Escherichia coli]
MRPMTDESQLAAAGARALRARELLKNELLVEAFKTLEDNYASAWRSTALDDIQGREKL